MEVPTMVKAIVRFFNDEEGATSIEYSLIAMLISMGILTVGTFFNRFLN